MEKPKKTYFDHTMEQALTKARFLVDDLRFIRQLYKDGRDEVAYGFTLATIESAEEFALQVRQLGRSQKIPDSEPEIQRMVDATYKVELGLTQDGYFCLRFPRLIPGMGGRAMIWAMSLLTYKPKKKDKIGYQYATAIPIGTANAQSFNTDLAEQFGRIVGKEMNQFGVHLWLAPTLNIHHSIPCGRNFEYYSEDPFISGVFAGAITKGIQSVPNAGVTIKHYAFNNLERNRTQNNSQVSERVAREIYLKGFGICVRMAQPKAVTTSYNLVNGIHTNGHIGLIRDVLRREFGFEGIVMTDWIIAGYENEKDCLHPPSDAARVCIAGGDLFMPGSQHDYNRIKSGLAQGTVTKKQLQINTSRFSRMAKILNQK